MKTDSPRPHIAVPLCVTGGFHALLCSLPAVYVSFCVQMVCSTHVLCIVIVSVEKKTFLFAFLISAYVIVLFVYRVH